MNVIVAPRAGGKTYQLVEWYKKDPTDRKIVVDTLTKRYDLEKLGVKRTDIIVLDGYNDHTLRGHGKAKFGFDIDMDNLFFRLFTVGDGYHELGPVTVNGAAKDGQGNVITPIFDNPYIEHVLPERRAEVRGEWIE